MRDSFPFLDSLTIPVDAGSGDQRVVITADGAIQFYDATGELRIQLGGSGLSDSDKIQFFSGDVDESSPARIAAFGGARAGLELASPEVTNQTDRARIDLSSPVNDPGTDRARIDIYGDEGRIDAFFQFHTINIDEGANAPMGLATLVAGTVTVANTQITANTRIFSSRQTAGGALGHLSHTRIAGTSFTINSSSATDTSSIAWLLIQPF